MPLVRVDDKGKKVPQEVEVYLREYLEKSEKRQEEKDRVKRDKLKSLVLFLSFCSVASVGLFYFVSHDVGIFTAILSTSASSVLNLYSD